MSDEIPRRQVGRDDLTRLLAIIAAVQCREDGDEGPFDQILTRLHDHHFEVDALMDANDEPFVGPELTAVELSRAALVVEALLLHDGEMYDLPARASRQPCVTCVRPTTGLGECLDCRARRIAESR